eukprot:TRINITY_DN3336_c0_g1_i1.p1 TRINITY_DN3336_c0_g1~~TRINITY_DN3336_c0_g1_i1.p1  ORF type:complete len:357 (+),score=31.05 TRINITY_DN3336_c0_g1_i1:86-1156(+)
MCIRDRVSTQSTGDRLSVAMALVGGDRPTLGFDYHQLSASDPPCQVLLQGMWPRAGCSVSEIMDYPTELQKTVEELGGVFDSYNHHNGELKYHAKQPSSGYTANVASGILQALMSKYGGATPAPLLKHSPAETKSEFKTEPPASPEEKSPQPGMKTRKRKNSLATSEKAGDLLQAHEYQPLRATCGSGSPARRYVCFYCGHCKVSSSSSSDGAVRIRCPCGGRQGDGVSRMHAKWKLDPNQSDDLDASMDVSELDGQLDADGAVEELLLVSLLDGATGSSADNSSWCEPPNLGSPPPTPTGAHGLDTIDMNFDLPEVQFFMERSRLSDPTCGAQEGLLRGQQHLSLSDNSVQPALQ